ncbi:MAG: hypothetical protein ACLT9P_09180 [Evtepia gabavorous]
MKQPDDIFSQMLPFWEHLTPQEQMALREASVPSTLPKGTITHRADQDCKGILLLLSGQLRAFLLSEEGRESDTVPGAGRVRPVFSPPPA